MASNYRKLGDFIEQTNERNSELLVDKLLGVSIEKKFIPSIANTIGTDFSGYKIVHPGEFAYGPVTSRNGDKISIAFYEGNEDCIISSSYTPFALKNSGLLPEYLMMWFDRNEFDRYARFKSHGSAREVFDWEQLCEVELPVPSVDVQEKVVSIKNCIDLRAKALAEQNDYLLELLKASAKNLYADYERNEDLELPEDWRWVEIDEIAEMVCRGITPKYNPDSDETVLGQTCVRNNLVLLENGRLHMPRKVTEKWLQKYDLLINSTGVGSLGRTAQVWFDPSKLVVDSHVTIVRAADPRHALYMGFWAFEHERYIESLHTGSTGQTELPRDHVKAIRLVLPSDAELEKFNAVAQPAVELIVANQKESKRLAELRDTLLPKLMSGEIDVSSVAI